MDVDTKLPWRVQNIMFVLIRLARPTNVPGPQHDFLHKNGTNDHEQPRPIPLVPIPSERVKTRPQQCVGKAEPHALDTNHRDSANVRVKQYQYTAPDR